MDFWLRRDWLSLCLSQLKKEADQLTGKMEKDVVMEADRLDVKEKAPLVLAELLFDENIMQQIKRYRSLFLRVSTSLSMFR